MPDTQPTFARLLLLHMAGKYPRLRRMKLYRHAMANLNKAELGDRDALHQAILTIKLLWDKIA